MSKAEYQRARSERFRALGLCVNCGREREDERLVRCTRCRRLKPRLGRRCRYCREHFYSVRKKARCPDCTRRGVYKPLWCECGTLKDRPNDECCAECAYLDGIAPRRGAGARGQRFSLIQDMRSRGGYGTVSEIADSLGITRRSALRMLQALARDGRVGQVSPDTVGAEETAALWFLKDDRAAQLSACGTWGRPLQRRAG